MALDSKAVTRIPKGKVTAMDTLRHGLALPDGAQSAVSNPTQRSNGAQPTSRADAAPPSEGERVRPERRREFATGEFKNELPQEVLAAFRKTNVLVSCGLAVGCLLSIVLVAASITSLHQLSWMLAAALYPLAGAIIARQQRGLELLVHDGSHCAWHRKNPRLNDLLTNLLAAYPSFTDVRQYWIFHKPHHAAYGSDSDPCKQRFEAMRSAFDPGGLLPTMVSYATGWYREAARKPGALLRAGIWHFFVFLLPLSLFLGWSYAFLIWFVFWPIPQFVFLPWLRFVAEMEEHDYSEGLSESNGTYTNVGWLHAWVVHPMHDMFHMIHHAFPSVPQWRHKALHRLLMQCSPKYRASRGRTKLLGSWTALREVG